MFVRERTRRLKPPLVTPVTWRYSSLRAHSSVTAEFLVLIGFGISLLCPPFLRPCLPNSEFFVQKLDSLGEG